MQPQPSSAARPPRCTKLPRAHSPRKTPRWAELQAVRAALPAESAHLRATVQSFTVWQNDERRWHLALGSRTPYSGRTGWHGEN